MEVESDPVNTSLNFRLFKNWNDTDSYLLLILLAKTQKRGSNEMQIVV